MISAYNLHVNMQIYTSCIAYLNKRYSLLVLLIEKIKTVLNVSISDFQKGFLFFMP